MILLVRYAVFLASPEKEVCDEWISTLQTTLAILYQKSPIFSQEFLRVSMMDGTFTTMPMTENTKCKDVIRYMAKKHGLNNESEFGLLESALRSSGIRTHPPPRARGLFQVELRHATHDYMRRLHVLR